MPDDGISYPPIAISPDGSTVAYGAGWGDLSFWNWETNELVVVKDPREFGGHLYYSPDGRLLYAEVGDHLAVFNTRTLREVDYVQISLRRDDNPYLVSGSEISPDGRWMLSTRGEFLKLTNLQTFEQTDLPIIANSLGTMHWPSLRFFSGTEDGRIQQWWLKNINLGPFITTAMRTIVSEDAPAIEYRIRPKCCGKISPLPEPLVVLINELQLDESDARFEDSRLLMNFPSCGWPLKLNPFFMDIRNYADFPTVTDDSEEAK